VGPSAYHGCSIYTSNVLLSAAGLLLKQHLSIPHQPFQIKVTVHQIMKLMGL
jgi:hypothetical protein